MNSTMREKVADLSYGSGGCQSVSHKLHRAYLTVLHEPSNTNYWNMYFFTLL